MEKKIFIRGGVCPEIPLAVFALCAASASAGVKYWSNPAFKAYDADSYVQDGLVLNYDGIRNVGLDQEHSDTTTTWVNLGSGGATYDLDRYYKTAGSGTTGTYAKGDTYGEWADDGFVFNRDAHFMTPGSFALPATYSVQLLIDASASAQQDATCGYVVFPNSGWQKLGIAIRKNNTYGSNGAFYAVFDTAFGGTSTRPYFSSGALATPYRYGTAIVSGNTAMFFAGTSYPTSGNGLKTMSASATAQTLTNFRIGGGQGSQDFTGTLKNFRFYSGKVLSADELVWNRAIDDYRYFGTKFYTIPATNAVIASAVAGLSVADVPATEPPGAYAVDDSGHTFTAPATSTVNGRTYACTGYTLETWDDSTGDWGTPVSHSGELSCAATGTSRIRITWQWTPGDGIVTRYTAADYVQDGLLYHYDGIQNCGTDLPHSYDAKTWKNLAPDGGYDLNFHASASATEPGEWRDDGYRFERESWFSPDAKVYLPSNQTVQIAFYANPLDQYALNNSGTYVNEAYLYYNHGTFDKGGALSVRKDLNATGNSWIDWSTHGYGTSDARPCPTVTHGSPFEYVTAILADDYAAAFFGTNIPTAQTSRWTASASRRTLTSNPQVQNPSSPGFGIGRIPSNDNKWGFRGVMKNFRFYDRVLENEELAWNRMVDDYRFHGVMPVTNVIVATSHSFLSGSEKCGNYEISGRYTFTAPSGTQTDARGFAYAFKGYTLEEWNASTQGWGDPVSHASDSYEYVVGTAAGKVRLTWVWEASGNLRTAADYGLEDIVPSGLALHYDGIKNLGAECDDAKNPTNRWSKSWVNLANQGSFTLSRVNKTTKAGDWTTDGFAFTNESASVGSYFKYTGALTLTPSYTWQFLLDAKVADQSNETCGYIMFNDNWKQSSLGIRTKSDYKYGLYYVPDTAFQVSAGDYRPKVLDTQDANSRYAYATAILKGCNAMLFAGTEYPTDSVGKKTAPNAATAQTLKAIGIGGCNAGDGSQDFTGKVKSVRYYDRVLTEAELVRNRQVDSARYFGELAFTNVVVTANGFDADPAPGAYAVEGSWTFSVTKGESEEAPTAVRLRTIDRATGEVIATRFLDATTWTYDADAENGALVEIDWRAAKPFVIVLR